MAVNTCSKIFQMLVYNVVAEFGSSMVPKLGSVGFVWVLSADMSERVSQKPYPADYLRKGIGGRSPGRVDVRGVAGCALFGRDG